MHNPQYKTERETAEIARKAPGTLCNDRQQQRGIPSIQDGSSIRSCLDDVVSSRESRKMGNP